MTYNSAAEIGACLEAAQATGADIIVVNNATRGRHRRGGAAARRQLLENPGNRGIRRRRKPGRCGLLDCAIDPVAESRCGNCRRGVEALVEALPLANVGLAGGQLIDERGRSAGRFRGAAASRRLVTGVARRCCVNRVCSRKPLNWHYRCLGLDLSTSQLKWSSRPGAFLMFRREVWERLGGFDEGFHPLWFEDVDFCRRARGLGYRTYYVPDGCGRNTRVVTHLRKISVEIAQALLVW